MSSHLDTTSRIGGTLIMLQKIEALLRAVLILATKDSKPDLKLRKLLRGDRQTMGMLLNHLSNRVDLPQDFADTLEGLLEKRNTFIHKLFLEEWFDLKTQDGLDRVNEFITDLLAAGSISIRVCVGYTIACTTDEKPTLPPAEREMFDHIIKRIFSTAMPDFGKKTPDEYIADFTEAVRSEVVPKINTKT
jgi:hypothetical protein